MAYIELEYAQDVLLGEAADIANEDLRMAKEGLEELATVPGQVFRADPVRSEKGGLCLSIDEVVVRAATPEQLDQLRQIGRDALRRALVENKDKFVGIILGEARQGRSYFDRFSPDEQARLF